MAVSLGVTTLETSPVDELLASLTTAPRQFDIVVKSGQGVCPRGQMMSKEVATGKYLKHDGTLALAGVLVDGVDATSADQKATVFFGGDFNKIALFSSTTINIGLDTASQINIK